jgi:structural maintenance of chromosomes protein 6
MAPVKRPIASVSEDDSDLEEDGSSQGSDSSQTIPVSLVAFYTVELMRLIFVQRKRRKTTSEAVTREDSQRNEQADPQADSDDEEAYELMATQAIHERKATEQGNVAAECGILEEVHVEDFMNHKNFTYELGPLINFICGKNGSGKSAILTALTLCLGGKASSTNRGQSLRSFIREGQDRAIITVKIKNQGDGAYRPDEYGNSIIVERSFNKNGSGGFKLKSETGRLISMKKADLEDICDHFSLQMDNPMNVLSQDMARQFISSSNASDKYRFFLKGVQLERLDQDYRLIEENLDHIEAKIEAIAPDLKVVEEKMEKARNKLAMSDRHNGILDKIREYRRQLAWAQVEAQERIRDEYVKEISIADEKITEAEAQLAKFDERYQSADQASAAASAAHQQAEAEVVQVQREKAEAKERHDDIKRETQDVQAEQRTIRSALKEAEDTIIAKRREIQEEEQRLAALDGGGAAARLAMLDEAREAAATAHAAFEAHQAERSQLDTDMEHADNNVMSHQDPLRRKRAEVERRKEELDSLSRDQGQQDLAYHRELPNLLRAIQNERSFTERPIGPIGKHVRLLKPKWSSVLEKSFGGTLNSFIVTSKRDMNTLNGIMHRVRCTYPIIIGNTLPLDTTPHEPDAKFDTILRALAIDNDLVRKQLVIAHAIEQTILIEDLQEASKVLYEGARPRNVKMCFSLDPINKRRGYLQKYTGHGNASQDPLLEWSGPPRMRTDIEAQVRLRQETLDQAKRELNGLEVRQRTDREKLERAKQAIVRHKRRIEELKVAYQTADDRVEELNSAISEDSVENGRLQIFQTALKEAEEAKNLHEGSFQDAVIAYDAKREQLNAARAELQTLDDRITELQVTSKKAEAEAQRLSKKRATALGEKNGAIGRIDDARQDRASLERKRQELETKIEDWIGQASQVSPRVIVDPGETEVSIRKKYEKLDKDYKRYQQEVGATREEIAAEAARTDAAYRSALRQLRDQENLAYILKASLMERRERWKKFRNHISGWARAQFTYYLSERSFRGSVRLDHKQKLLELSVEPDITKRDGSGRGAKTLSGGEKSFSQICLLLSIWEAMGSPIRCLDEFDVFMDSVNRKMSIDMLIGAAKQSLGRQFVLISPGTKEDFKKIKDVHVKEYVIRGYSEP